MLHPVFGRFVAVCFWFVVLSTLHGASTGYCQSGRSDIAPDLETVTQRIRQYHTTEPVPSGRTLHIVYWTPKDREPIAAYRERLSRVLLDIREFYRTEMIRLGLGDKTISLAMDGEGLVKIHLVRGQGTYEQYNGDSGGKIRVECLPTFEDAGIDTEKETIVIFCNMSNWDPVARTMSQNSPYYAGGGKRNGTAWQVDSALLDSDLLSEKDFFLQDGQYGRVSLGKYNSIFVGGVCHELGHALGLPHNRERSDEQRRLGTSLMGSGNRTYGDERRGEGRGSFLALADGLRLASHPLFIASEKGIDQPTSAKITDIAVAVAKDSKSFQFSGRLEADPPAYAVVGYIDPSGGSDYDAFTVTAIPDKENRFVLPCTTFKKGAATELRIVVCQVNGGSIDDRTMSVPFSVDEEGGIDLSTYTAMSKLTKLTEAVKKNDFEQANAELTKIEKDSGNDDSQSLMIEVARSLVASIHFQPGPVPAEAKGISCWLSESKAKVAEVGWMRPSVNRLPNDTVMLSVNGRLFARGLYAHAPSTYTYELGKKWQRLTGFAGLADGHGGTVGFTILGDGKEIWRREKPTNLEPLSFDLDVSNVQDLTFAVDNAGDGNGADWGVWTDLKVHRN
jgi:NPCBM/NEW2 domain